MPVTIKKKGEQEDDEQAECFTRFIYKPHWFVVSQTDGQPLADAVLPTWNRAQAIEALNVTEEPFAMMNGNCPGLRTPGARSPYRRWRRCPSRPHSHELAHVLLGHTAEGEHADDEMTPRNLRECEAEAVALLWLCGTGICRASSSRGATFKRGGEPANPIPERSRTAHPEGRRSDS
jgi:hypothetical protein